jgi:formamidopyrimidine-DNA glycosylase
MPELPEVETVRDGLQRWVAGRVVADVTVLHPRAIRRHLEGHEDFVAQLRGATIHGVHRRGKYLWLTLRPPAGTVSTALIAHLGMSGQLLVAQPDAVVPIHLRVLFRFADGGSELRFVDQRTFGGMVIDDLVATEAGDLVPALVAHIARDPIDERFDDDAWVTRMRASRSSVKRTLLDQTVISGVGNIYADESLWRSGLHGQRPAGRLRAVQLRELLAHIRAVLTESLRQGGTSFDSLYVNVNGQSGYFDRSLAVYGQQGQPCPRCGAPVRREAFMNRSSYSCPRCQPRPRLSA